MTSIAHLAGSAARVSRDTKFFQAKWIARDCFVASDSIGGSNSILRDSRLSETIVR